MNEADLLILLGTDFPYADFLPQGGPGDTKVAQVDINGAHIGRRTKVSYPVTGDVAATIANILPHVEEKTDRSFLDKMLKQHHKKLTQVIDAYTSNIEKMTPLHPEFVADVIDEEAAQDAVFTVDTGMCNVWGARYITPNGQREQIGSFRHGSMANALPHAIGAQFADRDRQVISFNGDGGLAMLLGELLTVKLHNLPVKTFVFNNSSLGMVKLEMLVEGMPEFETDHEQLNFADIAAGMGIKSIRVEKPKEVRKAVREALAYNGPVLVEFVTDPNALSIPPTLSIDQLLGFSKAAARTVFDGGVGHMVDMAASNLRNIPRP